MIGFGAWGIAQIRSKTSRLFFHYRPASHDTADQFQKIINKAALYNPEGDCMVACPGCGKEMEDSADRCTYCGVQIDQGPGTRRGKADLLMKIGAIIFIFGLFLPILFVTGGVIFGAGAIVWLLSRR